MKFNRETTWEDTFEVWRKQEANNPGWIECATKVKGWPNWECWRRFVASQIKAEQRKWRIFDFTNTPVTIALAEISHTESDLFDEILKRDNKKIRKFG